MDSATDKVKEAVAASGDVGNEAVHRDAPEIENEIEATRARMGQTLEELHGKLNPTVLKDQMMEQLHEAKAALKSELAADVADIKSLVRSEIREAKTNLREATIGKVEHMVGSAQETVKETGSSLVETLRDNPVPTALVGIGLGWLLLNARARTSRTSYRDGNYGGRPPTIENMARRVGARTGELASEMGEKVGALAHRVEDGSRSAAGEVSRRAKDVARRAGEIEHDIGDSINAFTHDAEDTVGRVAERAGSTAMTVARDARDQAVRWESSLERSLRDNPLAAAAVAVAIGLAFGLAVPGTKVEDEWVGELRDRALDRAEGLANDALDRASTGADQLADSIDRSLRS